MANGNFFFFFILSSSYKFLKYQLQYRYNKIRFIYCGYKVSFEQPQKLLSNSIPKQMLGKWPPAISLQFFSSGSKDETLCILELTSRNRSDSFFSFGKNQHRRFGDSLERRKSIPRMPSLRPPILLFHQHDPYCQIPCAKLRDCTQVPRLPNAFRS